MRRKAITFLFSLLTFSAWAQQTVSAHVVDSETGEALPYVRLYLPNGRGTLTNQDGDFLVSGESDEIVAISYIGYEKISIRLADIPHVLRMKPLTKTLKEVVVLPVNYRRLIDQLKSDYKKAKNKQRVYFYRSLFRSPEGTELIEAFMKAYSVINLRQPMLLSGIQGIDSLGAESAMTLTASNIQKQLGLAPKTFATPYWDQTIKPMKSLSTTKKYYDVFSSLIKEKDGTEIIRLDYKWNEKFTEKIGSTRYLEGTLYVDARTYRLLRFDGDVGNMFQWVNLEREPSTMHIHMDYDYSHGYAEVADISIQGGNGQMSYRTLVFGVNDQELLEGGGDGVDGDLVSAVNRAGYDSTLWVKHEHEIVKRTREEEKAISDESEGTE